LDDLESHPKKVHAIVAKRYVESQKR